MKKGQAEALLDEECNGRVALVGWMAFFNFVTEKGRGQLKKSPSMQYYLPPEVLVVCIVISRKPAVRQEVNRSYIILLNHG